MKNRKGFTLAELLIVVAIIGVLVSISIPLFTGLLEKAKRATDLSNMRSAKAAAVAEYLLSETGTITFFYDAGSGTVSKTDVPANGYGLSKQEVEPGTGIPLDSYVAVTVNDSGEITAMWGGTGIGGSGSSGSGISSEPSSSGDITVPGSGSSTPSGNSESGSGNDAGDNSSGEGNTPSGGNSDDGGTHTVPRTEEEVFSAHLETGTQQWPDAPADNSTTEFTVSMGQVFQDESGIYVAVDGNTYTFTNGQYHSWYESFAQATVNESYRYVKFTGTILTVESLKDDSQGYGTHYSLDAKYGDIYRTTDGEYYIYKGGSGWASIPTTTDNNWVKINFDS